jgi:rubredoxin
MKPQVKEQVKEQQITCPRCGFKEAIKKGTREHKTGDKVTRYQCKKCKYKFTPNQKTMGKGKKHQTGRTLIDLDKSRTANLPGLRKVIHPDGTITYYYEFRRNRSDVNPAKRL